MLNSRRAVLLLFAFGWLMGCPIVALSLGPQDKAVADYASTLAKVQQALKEKRFDDAQQQLALTDLTQRNFEFALLQEQTRRKATSIESLMPRIEMPTGVKTRYGVLSPVDRQLVFICQDGGLRVRDLAKSEADSVLLPHADKSAVWRGVFSHDGARFFAGHQNGEVVVWDTKQWEIVQTVSVSSRPIRELAAGPDGQRFVAEGEKTLELWELKEGAATKIADVGPRYNFGAGLSFSPHGDLVATGGMFDIKIHDATTGAEVKQLTHASYTMGLQFSPDGKRVASAPRGNVNKLLAVFELKDSARLFDAGPFKKYVAGLAFSPDGKRLVATGCEKLLRIFDVTTGEIVLKLDRPECGAIPAFTHDGRCLGWSEPSGYRFIELPALELATPSDDPAITRQE